MLKRVKVWSYLAAMLGASVLLGGCGYDVALDSVPRVIIAWLNEDLFH